MTVTALDVRTMPDEALLSLYRSDERAAAAALAEAARRDRTDRAAASRAALRAEWCDAAYADYLAAEAACNGELVNRADVAAGVRDGFALWSGPRAIAEKYDGRAPRALANSPAPDDQRIPEPPRRGHAQRARHNQRGELG